MGVRSPTGATTRTDTLRWPDRASPVTDQQSLQGDIRRVSYYNEETGFCVLQVHVAGWRDPVTLVGRTTAVQAGEQFQAKGRWIVDARYGRQFRADELQTFAPTTAEGMQRYLASGAIRGIGPKLAERMVALYGDKLLDILNQHPDLLLHVRGIGPKKLADIKEAWEQTRHVRRIMLFLYEHGVSTARAFRIYRRYGDQAIEKIRENPYRLADDIWGIGFKTADQLAQRLGIDPHSTQRAEAATLHVLQQAAHNGHCALPRPILIQQVEQLTEIPESVIETALEGLLEQQRLIQDRLDDEVALWLPRLHRAEWTIAHEIHRLQHTPQHPLTGIRVERALPWVQERLGIALAAQQIEAVRQAVTQKVLVVTGGPGVGKTTIVRSIVEIFSAKGKSCVLAAPTGRAAKRLEETTGRPAKTIHRLLEFSPQDGGFRRGPDHPLQGDLFVLDETSMLDVSLAASFLRAVPAHACLVLVGDVDQLPSVGPGSVLADLIGSQAVPVV
ncbi:MAG TPA: ATP-dependent RecD-like DNA helicase, partial [Planctomycetaceae bacterium]|nr:ATP-dependent RecD-like DNA helicase [Planctomycetaceae bacterium]